MSDNNSWWLQLVQGIVAVALGLFTLLSRDTAALYIGLLVAIYLLVSGAVQTVRGLRLRSADKGSMVLIRGIVGLAFGIILVFMWLLDVGNLWWGWTFLAIALIIYGGLGLYTSVFQRGGKEFDWGPVLVNLALLVWGILAFVSRAQDWDLAIVSGWILLIIGAVIVVWSFLRRSEESEEASSVP